MSQAALAEELGTVREVLVRSLASLKRSGAVVLAGRGRYRIAKPSILRALAG
jgi:biotin operon repressor